MRRSGAPSRRRAGFVAPRKVTTPSSQTQPLHAVSTKAPTPVSTATKAAASPADLGSKEAVDTTNGGASSTPSSALSRKLAARRRHRSLGGVHRKPFRPLSSSASASSAAARGANKSKSLHRIKYAGPRSTATTGSSSSSSSPSSSSSVRYGANAAEPVDALPTRYFTCLFTKRSNKKHKTYDDGVVSVEGHVVRLYDMSAKMLGKTASYTAANLSDLHEGNTLCVCSKELEVVAPIEADAFTSGRVFLGKAGPVKAVAPARPRGSAKTKARFKSHSAAKDTHGALQHRTVVVKPRHDPDAPGAIVLWRPPMGGAGVRVPVVVDPWLGRHLRPHQVEGVRFMYECVMDQRPYDGCGCILADEMGLGKTLQAITLIWTLLKQGPRGSPIARKALVITPTTLMRNWVKEISFWLKDHRLRPLCVGSGSKAKVAAVVDQFVSVPRNTLLIISYEQFRINRKSLCQKVDVDLVVLDEGHRIKNPGAQITKAVMGIPTRRRVVLTGTPMQNDLREFYAMVDFINPGLLGTPSFFRQFYEKPINASRDASASAKTSALGRDRFAALADMTAPFILRRTADILEQYLPPKVDQVVFCHSSVLQSRLYEHYLRANNVHSLMAGATSFALDCIMALVQLCDHPHLVRAKLDAAMGREGAVTEAEVTAAARKERKKKQSGRRGRRRADDDDSSASDGDDDEVDVSDTALSAFACNTASLWPVGYDASDAGQTHWSGKMFVLDRMLTAIKAAGDRVVVVSNWVKTLDLVQRLLALRRHSYTRLDGSTNRDQRQRMVDAFNDPNHGSFVFLLSSKAGGVGLNLIGANRLVLMDSDWNPATDRQAMARVWRDGQKKTVWLYRLLTTGTIDEKIWQRQLSKQGLSRTVIDAAMSKVKFHRDDLKDIFTLNLHTPCDTHDMLGCTCWSSKATEEGEERGRSAKEVSKWRHEVAQHDGDATPWQDPVLAAVSSQIHEQTKDLGSDALDALALDAGAGVWIGAQAQLQPISAVFSNRTEPKYYSVETGRCITDVAMEDEEAVDGESGDEDAEAAAVALKKSQSSNDEADEADVGDDDDEGEGDDEGDDEGGDEVDEDDVMDVGIDEDVASESSSSEEVSLSNVSRTSAAVSSSSSPTSKRSRDDDHDDEVDVEVKEDHEAQVPSEDDSLRHSSPLKKVKAEKD